jgi:radical SAM superfamily enzyme YgiQ (UPF0313 family)
MDNKEAGLDIEVLSCALRFPSENGHGNVELDRLCRMATEEVHQVFLIMIQEGHSVHWGVGGDTILLDDVTECLSPDLKERNRRKKELHEFRNTTSSHRIK